MQVVAANSTIKTPRLITNQYQKIFEKCNCLYVTNQYLKIFEKCEMDCGAYREVKLLEHAMKIVERVLENRIRKFW